MRNAWQLGHLGISNLSNHFQFRMSHVCRPRAQRLAVAPKALFGGGNKDGGVSLHPFLLINLTNQILFSYISRTFGDQ